MAEALIQLKAVNKDYVSLAGVVHALRDVNIDIEAGEFVAIVGTSGSGKSTLMNILGCLDRPTSGVYTLSGIDVGERTSDGRAIVRNRLIGFIFQGFNLLARTTALENVELPLSYRGVAAKERKARAEEALRIVGLEGRMDHTPNQLSGGQQQRVAIARALVTDPPLLLADEPTGNLDTRTSLEVLSVLQRLNRERGITICLVTHEQDIASCAGRVITFRDGRIVSDVRREPEDAAAALAALPPADKQGGPSVTRGTVSEAAGARPIPVQAYVSAFLAMTVGLALGALYNQVFLYAAQAFRPFWIPLGFALVLESYFAQRSAKAKLGDVLSHAQRATFAVRHTAISVSVFAALAALVMPRPLMRALSPATPAHLGKVMVAVLVVTFALALLRYVLLWAHGAWQRRYVRQPRAA